MQILADTIDGTSFVLLQIGYVSIKLWTFFFSFFHILILLIDLQSLVAEHDTYIYARVNITIDTFLTRSQRQVLY